MSRVHWHEAGHAIAAWAFDLRLAYTAVDDDSGGTMVARTELEHATATQLVAYAAVSAAGVIGENLGGFTYARHERLLSPECQSDRCDIEAIAAEFAKRFPHRTWRSPVDVAAVLLTNDDGLLAVRLAAGAFANRRVLTPKQICDIAEPTGIRGHVPNLFRMLGFSAIDEDADVIDLVPAT